MYVACPENLLLMFILAILHIKNILKDWLIESFADWVKKGTIEASTPGWPISNLNTQLLDATIA